MVNSLLIGTFLTQKMPRDRKQAPPLPLWILVQWERRVLMSNCSTNETIVLGAFLLMAWGSLRFSDAQRMDLGKLIYHDETIYARARGHLEIQSSGEWYANRHCCRGLP